MAASSGGKGSGLKKPKGFKITRAGGRAPSRGKRASANGVPIF